MDQKKLNYENKKKKTEKRIESKHVMCSYLVGSMFSICFYTNEQKYGQT